MRQSNRFISCVVLLSFFVSTQNALCEAVDDTFTQISPTETLGVGEFIHGTGYRKLLVRVLMFGAISNQGIHYVPEGTDLLFAILYAGGYSEFTKLDTISIRRKNQRELIRIDLEELIEEGIKIPRLMDGDIVSIPYNWRKDISTVSLVTQFITSMTTFTLALVAFSKNK